MKFHWHCAMRIDSENMRKIDIAPRQACHFLQEKFGEDAININKLYAINPRNNLCAEIFMCTSCVRILHKREIDSKFKKKWDREISHTRRKKWMIFVVQCPDALLTTQFCIHTVPQFSFTAIIVVYNNHLGDYTYTCVYCHTYKQVSHKMHTWVLYYAYSCARFVHKCLFY